MPTVSTNDPKLAPQPYAEEPKHRWWKWPLLILVILVLAAGAGFGGWWFANEQAKVTQADLQSQIDELKEQQEKAEGEVYKNEGLGFQLTLPGEWRGSYKVFDGDVADTGSVSLQLKQADGVYVGVVHIIRCTREEYDSSTDEQGPGAACVGSELGKNKDYAYVWTSPNGISTEDDFGDLGNGVEVVDTFETKVAPTFEILD